MSLDNSMNQIYAIKQIYFDLGCMPKFLQIFNIKDIILCAKWLLSVTYFNQY